MRQGGGGCNTRKTLINRRFLNNFINTLPDILCFSIKAHYAFTMAEVLITLGIIGIVAAMTLPSLIQNHQKKVLTTQLKRTYSVLAQAIERSKADYGDSSGWGMEGYYNSESSLANQKEIVKIFASKYLVPYLSKVEVHEWATLEDIGYKSITDYSETDGESTKIQGLLLVLNDGSILRISMAGYNYGTEEAPDVKLTNVYILADINGKRGPNQTGKDIFAFYFQLLSGNFRFYSWSSSPVLERTRNLEMCKKAPKTCGQLIMQDGWEFKEDYPWW